MLQMKPSASKNDCISLKVAKQFFWSKIKHFSPTNLSKMALFGCKSVSLNNGRHSLFLIIQFVSKVNEVISVFKKPKNLMNLFFVRFCESWRHIFRAFVCSFTYRLTSFTLIAIVKPFHFDGLWYVYFQTDIWNHSTFFSDMHHVIRKRYISDFVSSQLNFYSFFCGAKLKNSLSKVKINCVRPRRVT